MNLIELNNKKRILQEELDLLLLQKKNLEAELKSYHFEPLKPEPKKPNSTFMDFSKKEEPKDSKITKTEIKKTASTFMDFSKKEEPKDSKITKPETTKPQTKKTTTKKQTPKKSEPKKVTSKKQTPKALEPKKSTTKKQTPKAPEPKKLQVNKSDVAQPPKVAPTLVANKKQEQHSNDLKVVTKKPESNTMVKADVTKPDKEEKEIGKLFYILSCLLGAALVILVIVLIIGMATNWTFVM